MKTIKKLRAILSVFLVLVLALPTFTLAVNDELVTESVVIVTEENGVRTGSSTSGNYEYIVVYDTVQNTISCSERNLLTNSTRCCEVNITDIKLPMNGTRVTIDQNTSSGFRCKIITGPTYNWHLERPKSDGEGTGRYYFECYENSSNETELETFRSEVSTLALNEATLYSKITSMLFSSFVSALLAMISVATDGILLPSAIASIISTVGLTGEAAAAGQVVAIQCNNCMYAIENVYWATDNMHF